jgi:hypothetical protein
MFNVQLEMLAGANLAIRRGKGSLCRSGEAIKVVPAVWFNTAQAYISSVDGLEEGFERILWNAQGAASFDSTEAAVIDPIVDDLAGYVEVRSNVVGSEIVGTHDRS